MKLPRGGNYLDPKPTRVRRALNLRPHKHSGRRLDHAHTSYAGLAFVWLIAGLVLSSITVGIRAETLTGPPGSNLTSRGAIGIGGTVLGPPPAGANIEVPANGQVFTSVPITVSGTCEKSALIEITRNGDFAGSTVCLENGRFTVEIDLVAGANRLVAKTSDSLGQTGPDSNVVNVTYNPPPFVQPPSTATLAQLRLTSETSIIRVKPNQKFSWEFNISGGKPPYALVVSWGDGTDEVVSRSGPGAFDLTHSYDAPGSYVVTIKAKDSLGNETFLQVVVVVEGVVAAGTGGEPEAPATTGALLILWPLYGGILLMIIAFWLGKKWRDKKLEQQGVLAPSPA